jgi:hypothetical protein
MEERAKALGMGGLLYYMCVLRALAPQPLFAGTEFIAFLCFRSVSRMCVRARV